MPSRSLCQPERTCAQLVLTCAPRRLVFLVTTFRRALPHEISRRGNHVNGGQQGYWQSHRVRFALEGFGAVGCARWLLSILCRSPVRFGLRCIAVTNVWAEVSMRLLICARTLEGHNRDLDALPSLLAVQDSVRTRTIQHTVNQTPRPCAVHCQSQREIEALSPVNSWRQES